MAAMRLGLPHGSLRLSAAVPRIRRRRIPHRRYPPAARLPGKDRVGFRPPHVSSRPAERLPGRDLDWRTACRLDPGFSARRPSFFAGGPPPDPHHDPVGRAARQPRRGRRLRLAVALRRAGGRMGSHRRQARSCANTCCAAASSWPTISTAIRVERVRNRIRRRFPNRAILDITGRRPHLPHRLRPLERYQIPGEAHLRLGYKNGPSGMGAHWRGSTTTRAAS